MRASRGPRTTTGGGGGGETKASAIAAIGLGQPPSIQRLGGAVLVPDVAAEKEPPRSSIPIPPPPPLNSNSNNLAATAPLPYQRGTTRTADGKAADAADLKSLKQELADADAAAAEANSNFNAERKKVATLEAKVSDSRCLLNPLVPGTCGRRRPCLFGVPS